jgi:hypothetical protein
LGRHCVRGIWSECASRHPADRSRQFVLQLEEVRDRRSARRELRTVDEWYTE